MAFTAVKRKSGVEVAVRVGRGVLVNVGEAVRFKLGEAVGIRAWDVRVRSDSAKGASVEVSDDFS